MPAQSQDELLRTQYEQERALYNQYEREKAMVEKAKPSSPVSATPRRKQTSLGEDAVNLVRTGMNAITFNQYPKMVGALNELAGVGNAEEDAKRLAGYLSEYRGLNPKKAQAAEVVGEIAPYFAAGPEMAVSKAIGAFPKVATAAAKAGNAYTAAREAIPLGTRLLPAAGKAAAEMAVIEGARGASEAKEGESKLASALKSATMAQPFGRIGEVAGTYAAGKLGKSISKMQAEVDRAAEKAGQIINQWRDIGQLQVTPNLSKLYQRSSDLREAVDAAAQSLGLPSTDPHVLTEAYSKLTAEATPVFRKQILDPFLSAIDEAAQPLVGKAKVRPLSEGIKGYAKAMKEGEAITKGRQVSEYVRNGAGTPEKVGPEVVAGKLNRSFVGDAERRAAAQAAIAAIGEQSANIPLTIPGVAKKGISTLLTGGPRGVSQVADFADKIGGGSFWQQVSQRTGRSFGASR